MLKLKKTNKIKVIDDEPKRFKLGELYDKYGILAVFLVMFIVFSFISPVFLRPTNLLNILRQSSMLGILAIGQTFVIISGGIDLSVGAIIAITTVVVADSVSKFGIIPAILIGLFVGVVLGLINGLGITFGKLPPFIMTLGTTSMASGLAFIYSKGTPIMINGPFLNIGNGYLLKVIPLPAVYFIVLLVISYFIMGFTTFGRYVYSIGSNSEATRLSGVNIRLNIIKVYIISGLFASITGIIFASQLAIGTAIGGQGYELKAITAVILGGVTLGGGSGTIWGAFFGTAIIGMLANIMNLTGVNPFIQTFLTGVILIVAVLVRRER